MKKAALLVLIFALTGCVKPPTTRDKVIQAIQEYVKSKYNDPASYQNIEYSPIDSMRAYPYEVAQQIIELEKQIVLEHRKDSVISSIYDIEPGVTEAEKKEEKQKVITNNLERVDKLASLKATPQITYYLIVDKNRTKNKFGALEVITVKYILDNTFKVMESTYEGN